MESLLDRLGDRGTWERFYGYKCSLACPKSFAAELRRFIDREAYLPVAEGIHRGDPFPLPVKKSVAKLGTERKRVVYTYPEPENTVLKLLTWLLLRRYDDRFSPGLYSFRPGRSAKDAIRTLRRTPGLGEMYAYKADIHDYFNSIPVPRLLPLLAETAGEDPALLAFLLGCWRSRRPWRRAGPCGSRRASWRGPLFPPFTPTSTWRSWTGIFRS